MRVPLLRDGENPDFDRAMAEVNFFGGGIPDTSRVLGHHQELADQLHAYNKTLRSVSFMDQVEIEILILATARRAGNRYAFGRHIRIARSVGVSESQLRDLGMQVETPDELSARQLCLVRLANEATTTLTVSDAAYDEFVQHFAPTELPAVLQLIGCYVLLAIVQRGVGTELEPEFLAELEACWPSEREGSALCRELGPTRPRDTHMEPQRSAGGSRVKESRGI